MITNADTGYVLRLKKNNLKINVTISSLCNRLGITPVKLIDQLKNLAREVPDHHKRFYVHLKVHDQDFEVTLLPPPNSQILRSIKRLNLSFDDVVTHISQYVQSMNLDPSYTNQLLGSYKSFTS